MMMQWKDYGLHCGILWCLLRMMFLVVKGKYITTASWGIGPALSHWWVDAISAIDWLQAGQHQGDEHHLKYKDARRLTRAALRRTKNEWFWSHANKLQSSHFASARIWAYVHFFRNAKSDYKSNMCPAIRMENGEFCGSADEQVVRWYRHFSGVLQNVSSLILNMIFLMMCRNSLFLLGWVRPPPLRSFAKPSVI